jgi:hypothetical protein
MNVAEAHGVRYLFAPSDISEITIDNKNLSRDRYQSTTKAKVIRSFD